MTRAPADERSGRPSARSMLLTLLGEYVARGDRTPHRDTLVRALETLGYTTSAARQALARSISAGWVTSTRDGRRTRIRLTPETRKTLREGEPRIYGFGEPRPWSGDWLLVVVRVPEERRELRDRLRTQLSWAGFGSLGGGLWISPHLDRAPEVERILAAAGGVTALAFEAVQAPSLGDPDELVEQAWDLGAIRARYEDFLRTFDGVEATTGERAFRAQTTMVHAWGAFPFVDPDLPDDLLPAGWPRAAARAVFVAQHRRWHEVADAFFLALDP